MILRLRRGSSRPKYQQSMFTMCQQSAMLSLALGGQKATCFVPLSVPVASRYNTISPQSHPRIPHLSVCLQLSYPTTKQYDSKDLTTPLESHCFINFSRKPNSAYMLQKHTGGGVRPLLHSSRYNCADPSVLMLVCGECNSAPSAPKGSVIYLASLARFASKEAASCV
jgi:hypothetical protein